MAINNNVTFRRKHRPVWYGMLCLVLITAAVAAVGLLPAQSSDLSSAESVGSYTLNVDGNDYETYTNLKDLIAEINENDGTDFTITVHSDDTNLSSIMLDLGKKEVTLTSSSDGPFTLTLSATETNRHFKVISGTLTLDKIILDGNETVGGITVEESGELIMNEGAVIRNCDVSYYYEGGVYNIGTFTMNGGEISCNTASSNGGGVYNRGTFTMNGGEISGNTSKTYGGGVFNRGSGTFTMNGGEISGNNAGEGGGVYSYGMFIMKGGEISNNNAGYGSGVLNDSGTFIMKGGKISGNTTEYIFGGGVYNYEGTFIMKGGKISGNTAGLGGGVYNYEGTFIMKGGKISGNNAVEGGGVCNENDSEFTMTGGKISGNTAMNGGGVYNGPLYGDDNSMFNMHGGEISGNTAKLGGGMYNGNKGAITIDGGEISGNTATGADENGSGGGIYTVNYADLTVGDGAVFSGNTAPKLRTTNVDNDHAITYADNISNVVLDDWVNVVKNAPAYNNYDINYPGDAYVVFIEITLSGSGTIKVTDSTDSTKMFPFKDGYVHVPDGVSSITLSTEPETGYEFVQFTMDDLEMDPTNVGVIGSMKIVAEFKQKDYIVTATSDDGSTITPSGNVDVSYGENVIFEFSAKEGYRITAVFVDSVPLSPEELASGVYILNVKSNHVICVESEADVGIGGGETGTGPGNGNGTGSGSDGGKGDIEDGNGNGSENVGSGPNLSESLSGEWSVLGLICAVLAILTGMIAVAAGKGRFRTDNEEKRSKTGMTLRVMALMIGVISTVAFFLMEDWGLSAAAFGEWTLLMFVLFLAALILAMVSFRFDGAADEAGNGN